jgi:hypothetical protein
MIVIAAYNKIDYIINLLNSIDGTIDLDERVLVTCTCPKEQEFISSVSKLINESNYTFDISYTVTPYSGYDSGAYIWAYQNYHDNYYIFLHDTVQANHLNWFKAFKTFRDEMTINTWCFFNINDETCHTDFFLEKINAHYSLNGSKGVFGPIFQISKTALSLIDQRFDLTKFIPSNKMEAAAMERGWAYIANSAGLYLNDIDGHYSNISNDYQDKLLTKFFPGRI